MILPSGLFGKSQVSRQLNVGILGCGDRGPAHARHFFKIPNVRIRAVCDIWPLRAGQFRDFINETQEDDRCKVYHDFRELCADPEIDMVTVAVPDHWHALAAIEAVKNGKHVYLEKPLAYSVEEGRAVLDAVQRGGVIVEHGTQQRSISSFQRATYLAHHGHLGEVNTVYAISPPGPIGGDPTETRMPDGYDYDFFTGPAPRTPWYTELAIRKAKEGPGWDFSRAFGGPWKGTAGWYFNQVFGGGWVTAWGSHHVDSAQFALGKDQETPVRVEFEGNYPETGAFDTAYSWYGEYTYADGKKLIYCTSDRPEAPKEAGNIMVIGEKGTVSATRGKMWAHPGSLLERAWPLDDPGLQALDETQDHVKNWVDAITEGTPLAAPIEIGHRSTTLCHLANIGIEIQRPFEWDGRTETIKDDPLANRLLGRPLRDPWKL
jgi:predicted dehydrogenase